MYTLTIGELNEIEALKPYLDPDEIDAIIHSALSKAAADRIRLIYERAIRREMDARDSQQH
jgi:hypothetical protein